MKIKLFTKGSNNCRLWQLWTISDPEYLPKYEMLFMKCVVYAGLPMICVSDTLSRMSHLTNDDGALNEVGCFLFACKL